MIIYIDLLLFLNFCYDFLILLTIDVTLKRNTKIRRIVLSSIIGALAILLLFIKFNPFLLFLVKILISVLMVIIAFKYINLKYTLANLFYMYMISITLAGFLYFLNTQFSYYQAGIVFVNKGLSVNYLVLLIIAPIVLFFYVKSHRKMKTTYNLYQQVKIIFKNNQELICQGFIDSGNKLIDPITHKYIILVENNLLQKYINPENLIYVSYKTLNKKSLLKCYRIKKITIKNKDYKNYLVGQVNRKFFMEGIDCLLNYKLLEDL